MTFDLNDREGDAITVEIDYGAAVQMKHRDTTSDG